MIRKNGFVGKLCVRNFGMGKNGNEHKQLCEELDGDENRGGVWFT